MYSCILNFFFSFEVTLGARSTPPKTPNRKVPQRDLMWAPELCEAFLTECLTRKEMVQAEDPPIRVWKEIASALGKAGYTRTTWQMCRAKLHSLNEFFSETLLKTGGILGGVVCPYYTKMCALHDLPPDYEMPTPVADAANSKYLIHWQCFL